MKNKIFIILGLLLISFYYHHNNRYRRQTYSRPTSLPLWCGFTGAFCGDTNSNYDQSGENDSFNDFLMLRFFGFI